VAFIGGGLNRPSSRDTAPGPRFVVFAIISIVCMYYDQRDGWISKLRYYMQAAAYPVQLIVSAPQTLVHWGSELTQTREELRAENADLKRRERELSIAAMRFAALEHENAQLRALGQALPPLVTRSQVAEVVSFDLNPLKQRLLLNRGARSDIFNGQAVVDARGLLGQTVRVGPWSAEVILITDPEHAVPVQLVRNGLRSIAVGAGNSGELLLPYLPVNSDVKPGDVLVTSGLGGVFPAGYPVAVVTGIKRDPVLLLAQVRARPLATLERDREVMLVWFDARHPAAPATAAQSDTLPQVTLGAPTDRASADLAEDAADDIPPAAEPQPSPEDVPKVPR
jgi:rod shape-determining protein MreC